MAGIISFDGYDGAVYLMGWTGGYVLLALLLPISAKFGNLPFQILLENVTQHKGICALVVFFYLRQDRNALGFSVF
jgi:cation/acetate symporter